MNDVGGVVLTFIDITQLRRAEDKLVEAEKRFRELAESIDEVFWMASADGAEMLYVSPGFERIWGRPVSFVHEQPGSWLETVHPEDREQLTQLLFHAEPNQTWEIEYRILCPDGSERWIRDRGMAIADRQGQIVRLTGVAEDISERKKADERLRILERAVEQSVDSIVVADLDGRILFANAGCGRLHGYSPDELLGKPICMLHDPSHEVDNGLCPFLAGVDEPGWAVREVEHARRDGTRFPAEKTVSVLCGPDGQRLGYVVIARDQTAQRRAQQESAQLAEQLARTVRELKRSNSELEHFAYVASHDLQEPLRTMASFCRLLEQKYKDKLDDDANRYIEHVVSGANRMKALVSGLLAFSRVTMRGQSFEPTDMDEVVEGALANLRTTIVETNARITHDQLPTIDIDRAQFTQLMQNLIGNGIKFHDGGAPKIHVGVEDKDDHWLFSVRDNGIGISEEYTSRIFSIFQRLHTHDEYPGTGIGLALCKRIVERRGGRIWAESAPGEGSTFFFTIPKEQPTATPLDASFDNKPDSPTQQGDA
jgi:PAS domain S-box-containing protein